MDESYNKKIQIGKVIQILLDLDLPKHIEHVENIIEHFWKRWRLEYVTSLRECQRNFHTKKSVISGKN